MQKFDGMVQISPHVSNVIHLLCGYVYIFYYDHAESIDKLYRTEHISWWKNETLSKKSTIEQ